MNDIIKGFDTKWEWNTPITTIKFQDVVVTGYGPRAIQRALIILHGRVLSAMGELEVSNE
jgi:hypothetical protein